jgi:hypothetical protein
MKPQAIDTRAMTRRIRDAHHEQLHDATAEQRIRFFREKAARLHDRLARERVRADRHQSNSAP